MKKIKSKPIIDIVAGVYDLDFIDSFNDILKINGFVSAKSNPDKKLLFKSDANAQNKKTHIIHIVQYNGRLWFNYIIFRDYMNTHDNKAREYENLKLSVNGKYKYALPSYIKIKSDFINKIISENFYTTMLGKNVTVKLDLKNPVNYPKYDDGVYPLISGYIKNLNIKSYVIGVYDYNMPGEFNGDIIAYINNNHEKIFIAAKDKMIFYKPDICEAVKIFDGKNDIIINDADIVCRYEKSCGAVVYTRDGEDIKFLLVKGSASNRVGFPKGHIEKGETEAETAAREIYEETSLNVVIYPDFKEEYAYIIGGYIHKKVVYFLAEFNISDKYKISDSEILEQWLVSYEKAYELLTFNQDKTVLKSAYEKIKNNI